MPPISSRQSMLIAGLLQGAGLLALHEWLEARHFDAGDLVWIAPLYAFAVIAPLTFSLLRGEFTARRSLASALVAALTITATAIWYGWMVPIGTMDGSAARWMREYWVGSAFVFGAASLTAWFVALPFLQGQARAGKLHFPYPKLFEDAWRNALLLANCMAFTGAFWLLLLLWSELFQMLKISFFHDLFTSRRFIYPVTAIAVSFAVSLEEHEASALTTLRRHLLAFQIRLLPLAALIVLLFLAALPFSGLQPLWSTGHATPLMLCLQWAVIALTNSAWQDGSQPAPFARLSQWLSRAAIGLLPVLAALCIWSLGLRIQQYGWTVDRVWAALLTGLTSLYAVGYGAAALNSSALTWLGKVNIAAAWVVITTLLATHTPLLDPKRIAVISQVSRLLAGKADAEKFDYSYLRFELGRAGNAALKKLSTLTDHPRAEVIRNKAISALAIKRRYPGMLQPALSEREIAEKLKAYPVGLSIDPEFIRYLARRLDQHKWDYDVAGLREKSHVTLLSIDLGEDSTPEHVMMTYPFAVFAHTHQGWRQIGLMNFSDGNHLVPDRLQKVLETGDYSKEPQQWHDLRLGQQRGRITLTTHQEDN